MAAKALFRRQRNISCRHSRALRASRSSATSDARAAGVTPANPGQGGGVLRVDETRALQGEKQEVAPICGALHAPGNGRGRQRRPGLRAALRPASGPTSGHLPSSDRRSRVHAKRHPPAPLVPAPFAREVPQLPAQDGPEVRLERLSLVAEPVEEPDEARMDEHVELAAGILVPSHGATRELVDPGTDLVDDVAETLPRLLVLEDFFREVFHAPEGASAVPRRRPGGRCRAGRNLHSFTFQRISRDCRAGRPTSRQPGEQGRRSLSSSPSPGFP